MNEFIKMIPEFLAGLVRIFFDIAALCTGLCLFVTVLILAIAIPIILWMSLIDKITNWLEEHLRREDKVDVSKRLSPVTVYHQIIEYERNKEDAAQCLTDGENTQKENPRMKGDTSAL